MAAYHADLMDHLHLPAPPGYTPVSVHQILRADRAAFLFMSEKMNTLKRSVNGTLPLDILLPSVLNPLWPSICYPSRAQQTRQVRQPKHQPRRGKGLVLRPDLNPRTRVVAKENQRRVVDPMSQVPSLERLLKHHKRRDCVGLSICQIMDAVQQSQVKPVPKDCTCAQNLGASSTILCNSIIEATIVSPHIPGCKGSLSANFSP